MNEAKRYGVYYEDLHDGLEASEDNGVVSMVQTSDHLATIAELTRERDHFEECLGKMSRIVADAMEETKAVTRERDELRERVRKVFTEANNAIYFDDSSDYRTALNAVCHELSGGGEWRDDEIYGETFIPELPKAPL